MNTKNRKKKTESKAPLFKVEHDPTLENKVTRGKFSKLVPELVKAISDLEVDDGHVKIPHEIVPTINGAEAVVVAARRRIKRMPIKNRRFTVSYIKDRNKKFDMAVIKRIS